MALPTVPENITVHLGPPSADAENVTVPFIHYIANVASSELYPTWPENALRANIIAQVSFALNRIYTEYYRSRGYDFDITNSTAYDQAYVNGRSIFENVRQLVGEVFTTYIRRENNVEPLFAQFCDGIEVTCNGLSQWGSVSLANDGFSPFEILQYYYGNDIVLMENTPVTGESVISAPPFPLSLGSFGNNVRTIQLRLNRISNNFPSIPKILLTDGIFSTDTEAAVKRFQEVFGLTPDGIVGNATWYAIQSLYISVKRLTDLSSEGIALEEVTQELPSTLEEGATGVEVFNLQFYINYLSNYYSTIPALRPDGVFGPLTKAAVEEVQRTFGLSVDGVVGPATWYRLYNAYLGIANTIPDTYTEGETIPYGGVPLRLGSESESVRTLQQYLNYVAQYYPEIPSVTPTGYFGTQTQQAVLAFQRLEGLTQTGVAEAATWTALTALYDSLYIGNRLRGGQYPGYEVGA